MRAIESPVLEEQVSSARPDGYGTLPGQQDSARPTEDDAVAKGASRPRSLRDILRVQPVKEALLNYAALALIAVMHDATWTLW